MPSRRGRSREQISSTVTPATNAVNTSYNVTYTGTAGKQPTIVIPSSFVHIFAKLLADFQTSFPVELGNKLVLKGKGKVFPYSLPSIGRGADTGVQTVSLQVT